MAVYLVLVLGGCGLQQSCGEDNGSVLKVMSESLCRFSCGRLTSFKGIYLGLIDVDHEFHSLMDVVYGFNKGVQLLQRLLPYHENIVFIFQPDQWCKFMCSYGVLFEKKMFNQFVVQGL